MHWVLDVCAPAYAKSLAFSTRMVSVGVLAAPAVCMLYTCNATLLPSWWRATPVLLPVLYAAPMRTRDMSLLHLILFCLISVHFDRPVADPSPTCFRPFPDLFPTSKYSPSPSNPQQHPAQKCTRHRIIRHQANSEPAARRRGRAGVAVGACTRPYAPSNALTRHRKISALTRGAVLEARRPHDVREYRCGYGVPR
eukprot:scaffold9715_cov113-Isochrysis_galbana.AAC.13